MASFGTGRINPRSHDTYSDYLYAARDSRIRDGEDREKAEFDRAMYEANGEEWEGQYGGTPGY